MSVKLENTNNFQEKFNQILENNAPTNISLAKEISELLNISIDSTYRRLRNQTEYTLNEVAIIAQAFDIPLESLNSNLQNVITFKINHLNNDIASYQAYLNNMLQSIDRLSQFENPEITFAAEDIPVYYHFSLPHLRGFKIKYWLKSLMNVNDFQHLSTEEIEIPEEILQTAEKIYTKFNTVQTTEIWTTETVLSTIKQIRYYWDAGFFNHIETANLILNDLEQLILNIQKNINVGFKYNTNGSMTGIKHLFYLSDVMIGTNCILAKANQFTSSFISYSSFNFMQTMNADFNYQNELWLNNILSKSTLLSGVAEKQRNQFFKSVLKLIQETRLYLE